MPSQVDCAGWYGLERNDCRPKCMHHVQVLPDTPLPKSDLTNSQLQILQNPEKHPKIRQIDDVLRELGLRQLDIDQPENFSIDQQGVHKAFCDV